MSGVETRLPRAVFTKKLVRICERLDEAHERTVAYKDLFRRPKTARIGLASLWVVGSYARGAELCGDLDIVFDVRVLEGRAPLATHIARTFFGTRPYVSYYLGDPSKNSSGADFPDPVCIWSGPGCNWRAQIANIAVDPTAGRAPRETDAIPFSSEQLSSDIEALQEIAVLRDRGVLEWEFIPLDKSTASASEDGPRGENSKTSIYWYADMVGKKSRELFPAIDRFMKVQEPFGQWSMPDYASKSILKCGGTLVCMGRPVVPVHLLENSLAVRQLVIVPHLSTRGPNGIWLIRRGPSSPNVAKLAGVSAFYHVEGGRPIVMSMLSEVNATLTSGTDVIDIFKSVEEAESYAANLNEDSDTHVEVKRIQGVDLPQLTGLCEVVSVDGVFLPTEFAGRRLADRTTDGTIAELADLLGG